MCVSERENSSARLSQDEVDVTHQQLQQQSRRHGDDDDDGDGDGTTHEPQSPAEIRHDKSPHHHLHHRRHGDSNGDGGGKTREPHSPAEIRHNKSPHYHLHHRRHGDASAVASRRDVAVQVDDVTRQSSSSQVSHHM